MYKPILALTETQKLNFWAKVNKTDKCWVWAGYKDDKGYGRLTLNDDVYLAHRVSYFLKTGHADKLILHDCNNSSCVNPSHLYEGTYQNNSDDILRAGNRQFGSDHHQSTLTDQDVLRIRYRLSRGDTCVSLASEYGVTHSCISLIKWRKTWRHI